MLRCNMKEESKAADEEWYNKVKAIKLRNLHIKFRTYLFLTYTKCVCKDERHNESV